MNAYKQLLVHMDAGARSAARLTLARRVAGEQGAGVLALYAVMPTFVAVPYAQEIGPSVAASLMEVEEEHRAAARALFERVMKEDGPAAQWAHLSEVPLVGAFAQQALYADLLVLGQRDPDDLEARDVPADFVVSTLLASGRPGLVVPQVGAVPERFRQIAIAWKESSESAHAVTSALPLLQRADNVHVLAWGGSEPPPVGGARLDLAGYLRAHGVEAQFHDDPREPDDLGEILLSRVFDLNADLLVMGCYGHSRAREWVLGGASRTILRSMTLPVLMAH
jgi:nucleotide-binding universal stress UspA family protein